MVWLKCSNKKCSHKWDYNGNRKFTACCPSCGYKININKNKVNIVGLSKNKFKKVLGEK